MKSKYKKWHKYIKSTVKYFVKTFEPGRVLDVGARDGYAMQLLIKAGFDAVGLDINPESSFVAYDDFTDTKIQDKFDYIYCRHVLEHCADTAGFFASCHNVLKPGGILFLTVPLESKEKFEKRNAGKPKKEWNHKVYFESLEEIANLHTKYLGLVFRFDKLCMSEEVGILPLKNEVLLIASRL